MPNLKSKSFYAFTCNLQIIGINPFVSIPEKVLKNIFNDAGKSRGYIRVYGFVNGIEFEQTLVKYSGEWRLYINKKMLPASPKRIGEKLSLQIAYNPKQKEKAIHPGFMCALSKNEKAMTVFDTLSDSRKDEMIRYISGLKSQEAVTRNIKRAINFLLGKESFVGRKHP